MKETDEEEREYNVGSLLAFKDLTKEQKDIFIKLISDSEKRQFSYNPYSPEYTVQNYKSDMENLYKKIISEKILNSYITQNNSTKQRSNNQEEMSCLKLIADRNNTNKNFHK